MIIIFVGLPRNIDQNIGFIKNQIKKNKAIIIFSTNNEIYNYNLPKECIIINNDNELSFKKRINEIKKFP